MASRERDAAGRFVAGTDLRTRYAQIATVLRAADSDEPQRVSTRAFDAARESAGQPSLPAAKNLAELLGMPWPAVKAVALDATRDEVRTYKSRHRRDPRPWRDADGAVLAVKRVAAALGEDRLAATTYDVFREDSPAATRELLPTSAQIVKLCGSWNEALSQAGLAPSLGGRKRTALPVIEAIGLFVRSQGRLPRRKELERFSKDPRWAFSLQRVSEKSWQQWLNEFERWWVGELDRWMPQGSQSACALVPVDADDIAELPRVMRAPKGWWNRERVIECVIRYLKQHPGVRSLHQRDYGTWAREQSAAGILTAASSTLTKYGTLEELEREARDRMAKRAG